MDWVLDKVVDQSDCGASVSNTKITDLVFADDAVIFAESLEVLVMALEALHEEAKPLQLEVSWLKTKVQVFGDLLDEAVQSVHACGEDIEILESFTYLGSAETERTTTMREQVYRSTTTPAHDRSKNWVPSFLAHSSSGTTWTRTLVLVISVMFAVTGLCKNISETIEYFLLPPAMWQHAQRSYCLHLDTRHSRFTCTASVSPLTPLPWCRNVS
ncbi:hypothetical protein GWK47_034452 [Chionoecetes opilio]|uniref:Reverse transcriptase domain-containing protein n=1 Tax=Chionoecetes opilio TaxID=41210 RepID=A0A8J4YNZ9_CHIOP|nr:hypothetical protein GWK47_034452 [Chionoecetes opilio]